MPNPTFVPVLQQGASVSFGTLAVTGNASVGGTLGVTGNVNLSAALAVTTNVTIGGTLGVTAAATFTARANLNGGANVGSSLVCTGATDTSVILSGIVTGDAFDRLRVLPTGEIQAGPGSGTRDTFWRRSAPGVWQTDGSVSLGTAGGGLLIKEGANATSGVATLVAGTVTVNTTKVTASSRIQLTAQALGTVTAPKALGVTARTAGTSFTITSADNTDTSPVAWVIVEPAP